MSIELTNRSGLACNEGNLTSLLAFGISELGLNPECYLNVLLVDVTEMTQLHIEWMDEDGPTDVLSFPMDEVRPNDLAAAILGDIVLCPAVAAEQAKTAGHSQDHEISILAIHGLLHLVGYDHLDAKDEKIMFEHQENLVSRWKA